MSFDFGKAIADIAAKFDSFAKTGSWIQLDSGDDSGIIDLGIVCHYRVLSLIPHFDSTGKPLDTKFWLLFCLTGYEDESRHGHYFCISDITETEYGFNLTAVDGKRFIIERIVPMVDRAHSEQWKELTRRKKENPDLYARIEEELYQIAMAAINGGTA